MLSYRTMLKSTGVGATLSFNTRPVRRTLQVQHSGRRLISHTYKRKGGHSSGSNGGTDCTRQQLERQLYETEPDTSLLAEELQGQWHEKLNKHLGSIVVRPHSDRKVWWSCDQCPDKLPHVWEAQVAQRTEGTGCPFCSGLAVCQHNTLAKKAPQLALWWDVEKNHPLSPDQVTVSSNMRAHWKCSICLHEWQAKVTDKTRRMTGCPQCAKVNGGRKSDGTRQKHPTFAAAKHPLLRQWDHDRNRENGNFPDNTTLRSGKFIWWRCHECPKGRIHSWQARPSKRNAVKCATGCPFCAGRKVCECNSLETLCPDVAADFDVGKNGVSPSEVTSSASKSKYSWLSDEPGAKKRTVSQRTTYTKLHLRINSRH
ncbi:TPA: hypothetical protein ACH3X1_014375 [Trebouxia sp. C0004]